MGNPTTLNTSLFLAGQVLLPRSMLASWNSIVTYILPLTSSVLNTELETAQTQINNLLNATPNPSTNPLLIQIPIQLVVNLQNAMSNFEYKYGGPFPRNDYSDTVNQLDSVFNQYSRFYFDALPNAVLFYNG